MSRLLVVHHSPTPATRALTDAVVAGTRDPAIEGVETLIRPALEANAADVAQCDGVILGTPANFGYMSGALKHFFDSHFLAIGGALDSGGGAGAGGAGSRPFGLYVHGRYDVTGAVRSVLTITGALPWRQAADIVEVVGDVTDEALAAAYELGGTLAALTSA